MSAKERLRKRAGRLLPPGSPRRDVASSGLDAYRATVNWGRQLRRFALGAASRADLAVPYPLWLANHRRTGQPELVRRLARRSAIDLSVVVLVDARGEGSVEATVESLDAQWWPATDVLVATGADPLAALSPDHLTTGVAVVLCAAGDRFEPDALFHIAATFWENPERRLVVWDDDVKGGLAGSSRPRFRPSWSPDTLLSANYVGHCFAVRGSDLAGRALRPELGDDALWELLLGLGLQGTHVGRVTRVLVHVGRRLSPPGSWATEVVQAELDRRGWPARAVAAPAGVWLRWELDSWPTVSIVIPSRFNRPLLERLLPCLERTDYPAADTAGRAFDVTVIDNSDPTEEADAFYAEWAERLPLRLIRWDEEFNYSRVNNVAARTTTGDILVFLNDDTEPQDPRWLAELVGWATRDEIGTVGVQLIDGDGLIQHGGVIMGMKGLAEHLFCGMEPHSESLLGPTDWIRNSMAVTAACVAIRRDLFEGIGGFDERFELCGSDVVLGLDAHLTGRRNVVTPATRVLHLESATRGTSVPVGDMFDSWWRYQRWISAGDPYFSPSLSVRSGVPTLKGPEEPGSLDLLGPALGRQFTVFRQSTTENDNLRWASTCLADDALVDQVRNDHAATRRRRRVRTVTWFLPEFDSPFYGGINTALRIADQLRADHGVENRFLMIAAPNEHWFRSALDATFPELAGAPMWFTNGDSAEDLAGVPESDVGIATIWHSAFTLARTPSIRRRVYLIQDFEPCFYPAGTLYALAEETYRMGLYGLCNSPTMERIYRERYGGTGWAFTPAVDAGVFHPPPTPRAGTADGPVRVFLYARPGHWRNCWELASLALERVKARFGDGVHIVTAGSWARPEDLGSGIEHLGLLDYASTGDLYRTCDVGIALTVSEHPSYLPLELMACGVPVVAFDLPAGYWVLKDGENCLLSRRTADGLAERISTLVGDADLRGRLSAGALAHIAAHHADWPTALAGVHDFLSDPEGTVRR